MFLHPVILGRPDESASPKFRIRWFIGACCVLLLGAPVSEGTAEELLEDSQVWASVLATKPLQANGGPWRLWLEGLARFGNDMSTLSQGMIRPGIGYALSEHASVWMGYAHIFTDTPFSRTSIDEDRIWQQFIWTQAAGAGSFTTRGRLEERFVDNLSGTGWRYRHFFKISYPIAGLPGFSAVAFDEVFFNLKDTDGGPQAGFDQNRAFAGLAHALNSEIKTEIGYVNQFIDRPTNPNRMTHALAISLYLSFH